MRLSPFVSRGIDRDIETICQKCLEKSPDKRYASADELARDLRRYLDGLPIRARQAGPLERTWRFVRTNPQIAVTIAVLLLAVVVTGWGLVRAERSHRDAVAAISALLDSLDAKTDIVRQDESLKRDDLYEFRTSLLKAVLAQYQALLVDGRPATVDPVRLARALEKVGGIEQDLGDLASARTAYLGAATEWQKLAEKSDPTGDFRDARIDALCDAATAESSLSLTDEAKAHASLALALGKDRLAANPQSSRALARVARCYQTLGVIDGARNQYRNALVFQREAFAIRRQIVDREPTAENRFELAEVLRAIGLSRHKTDEGSAPIRAVFNEALQEVRSALRDEPRQLKYRQLEGRILSNRGMTDRRPEVAESDPLFLAAYERAMRNSEATLVEAVAVRRKLAEDFPAYAIHHQGLAVVLGNLADTYTGLVQLGIENPQKELPMRAEARAIYEKLYARRPEIAEYKDGLILHSMRLARAHHDLGNDDEVIRVFKPLVDAGIPLNTTERNSNDMCTAAICFAVMAASESDARDGRPVRLRQIVDCLQLAIDFHLARIPWADAVLANEPAFAVYRYEPEFQQVMSRFEAERRRWMREVSAEPDEIALARLRR